MSKKGKIIVLSGPSGVGKSTVAFKAMQMRGDLCFSISATTRAPRQGEMNGREYYFVDVPSFEKLIADDELLEHAVYVDNYYGTPRKMVEEKLEQGINVLLDIEIQGARQVFEKVPDAIKIFMMPPSLKELERRLTARGTDSPRVIEARLNRAKMEIQHLGFYDYVIVNADPDKAANELSSIITAEHCRIPK